VDLTCKSMTAVKPPFPLLLTKGNVTMVTLLIQAGADVNKADNDGQTPLTLAMERDTLFKSRREKRQELMERNRNYRKAIHCDPNFFPSEDTCTNVTAVLACH